MTQLNLDDRKAVTFTYVNWRGEQAQRRVIPLRWYYGSNEWHTTDQWLLFGWDLDKQDYRDYALTGISEWQSYATPTGALDEQRDETKRITEGPSEELPGKRCIYCGSPWAGQPSLCPALCVCGHKCGDHRSEPPFPCSGPEGDDCDQRCTEFRLANPTTERQVEVAKSIRHCRFCSAVLQNNALDSWHCRNLCTCGHPCNKHEPSVQKDCSEKGCSCGRFCSANPKEKVDG